MCNEGCYIVLTFQKIISLLLHIYATNAGFELNVNTDDKNDNNIVEHNFTLVLPNWEMPMRIYFSFMSLMINMFICRATP